MISKGTLKRLKKDSDELARDPPYGISAAMKQDNMLNWHGVIQGPPSSPYEEGIFEV